MADEAPAACRNCGTPFREDETPDFHGWCDACRGEVVRRSTRVAILPALVVLGLYLWLLVWMGMLESRLLVVWLALGAALAYAAFKVARRVAFDVIRSRGVRPAGKKT